MSNEKNDPKPAGVTEAGAVELNETDLDTVSGGPVYMKVEGIVQKVVAGDGSVRIANPGNINIGDIKQ